MMQPTSPRILLAGVGLLLATVCTAQEYTISVASEQICFVAQPEAGYVVKVTGKPAGISSMSMTLRLLQGKGAKPIRGLDRHGIWVVEDKQPAGENEKTISALGSHGQVKYAAPLFSCQGETVVVIPEIVVRLKKGATQQDLAAVCESVRCRIKKRMEFTELEYLLEVLGPDADAVFAAVEQLNHISFVEWACPNTASRLRLAGQTVSTGDRVQTQNSAEAAAPVTTGVFPNDEYWPMQWHLHNTGQLGGTPDADINAPEAWEITTGDPSIVIAVVDTGVDLNHPDLVNNLVPGHDFYENDNDPTDNDGHGTSCAGLIAAQGNNHIGVMGVTWECKVTSVRFRAGIWGGWQADLAEAYRWAAANGADVLNCSYGGEFDSPIEHSAIVDITKPGGIGREGKGCVVVACAGNERERVHYPGRYPEVIGVGATDVNDVRVYHSNYGPELDVMAPSAGIMHPRSNGIWSTDITGNDGYNNLTDPNILDYIAGCSGTSTSSAIVAGVAALILSVEPDLSTAEVRYFLTRSAKDMGDPGRDDYHGWGRVDARAALDMVLAKRADLNGDWKVNLEDFAELVRYWRTAQSTVDIAPATDRDSFVDVQDLILLSEYWMTEIGEMPHPALIAHWRLDETEGTVAHDSPNVYDEALYHGQVRGGPLWLPEGGIVDGALEFDGIDDYVSTPFVLDPADGPFSVYAWVKGGSPGQVIISQTGGADWLSADPSEGKLMTSVSRPAGGRFPAQPLTSEFVITDGIWHRVSFVWDGSNRILYVDDAEVARDTQNELAGSDGGLYIGAGKDRDPASFFLGLIDDVRIYNRAVTP